MLCLVIFLFAAGLLALIASLKIKIVVEVVKNGRDDHAVIALFTLGGVIKLKYEIPFLDINDSGIKLEFKKALGRKERVIARNEKSFVFSYIINQFKLLRVIYKRNCKNIRKIARYVKRKFVVENIAIDIVVGTGEADYTAIANGIIWAVVGSLFSLTANTVKVEKKNISIKSDFNEKKLLIDLYCIFSFKIVHIIVVGIKVLFIYLKGKLAFKNIKLGGGLSG